MVSIYSLKKNSLNEKPLLQVELRGLSTDTKPISLIDGDIENGSVFIEIDTQDVYIYDGENKEWVIPTDEAPADETPDENNKQEVK